MNTTPTKYAIRVNGQLDEHWSAWLGELDMTRNEDGTTTLTFWTADQAQLHGVLAGLRDIGAVITELRAADSRPARDGSLSGGATTRRAAGRRSAHPAGT